MKKIVFALIFLLFSFSFAEAAEDQVYCTMDAKMCPDWSYVGRTWPDCAFAPCPWEEFYGCNDIYKPVCASLEVQCIMAPCYPVLHTFANECEMQNNPNATFLHDWACEESNDLEMKTPATVFCTLNWWKREIRQDDEWKDYWVCIFDDWKFCGEWDLFNWDCTKWEQNEDNDWWLVWMPNPASVNCEDKWWTLEIREIPWRWEYGVCIFEDNLQCEEWALYRWDCPVWWVKITWYVNDESVYCAITGNEYIYKKTLEYWTEVWDCKMKSWEVADAREYYLYWNEALEEPLICNTLYSPVCWGDSKTYSNSCMASRVGLKYKWRCLSDTIEKQLHLAWISIIDKYLNEKEDIYNIMLLEQLIKKSDNLSKNTDSAVRQSSYSYLWYEAALTLLERYFEPYIRDNLDEVVLEDAVLGWTWYVTAIDWIDQNNAMVYYEDWHIMWNSKINITASAWKIVITKLEEKLEINHKFDDTAFDISMKIPNSWDWNYSYRFHNDEKYIEFYYKAKRESNATIFELNFWKADDWKVALETNNIWGNIKILDVEDYVVSYEKSINIPYKVDENISNFSIMINEVFSIIESLEVYKM